MIRLDVWRALVCALCLGVSCFASAIPLVGIDEDGNGVEQQVSPDDYVRRVGSLLASVEASTLPVLEKRVPSRPGNPAKRPWRLATFTLGIGVTLSLGIGNILSLALSPAFTLVFCHGKDLIIP